MSNVIYLDEKKRNDENEKRLDVVTCQCGCKSWYLVPALSNAVCFDCGRYAYKVST